MSFSSYGLLIVILQVITGVHAYRRGRYLWIALIIFVPLIGTLFYFFAEMLPGMRLERGLQSAGSQMVNTLQPGRRLAQFEELLEEQDTIATRQAYAEELMRHSSYDEAIRVLEEGLKGVFATDSQGLFTLAKAYAAKENYAHAQSLLDTIREDNPSFEPDTVKLLRARMVEAQGRLDEALPDYAEIAGRNVSEEPRFYQVRALLALEQQAEASEVFERAEKFYNRSSNIYRRENANWMKQMKALFNSSL